MKPETANHQPTLHRTFTVAEVRFENYCTKTLVFEESLPAQPGQFVMAWLPGLDEKPFSVAGARPLALTVVAVGPLSRALHDLAGGRRLWIRGPLGQGYRVTGRKLLLVGGGYGVAPLAFLARQAATPGCSIEVCIGARTAADVLLVGEFERAGAAVRITTEDGSLGTKGLVTAALEAAITENRPDGVYACGPVQMLEAVDRLCKARHLPCQLSWEAHMRCGIGLCGSCELLSPFAPQAGWLVCLDGPVAIRP